jgi:hypothetical protein
VLKSALLMVGVGALARAFCVRRRSLVNLCELEETLERVCGARRSSVLHRPGQLQ